MLAKNRISQFLAYAIGALLVWVIAGCGGGGAGSSGGTVALSIAWPKPDSRYIPPYALSLAFSLYSGDVQQPPINLVVNRPDTLPLIQQVEFKGPIPGGNYTLVGWARTGFNGTGDTVASAITNVAVADSGTTTVALGLASTLYSIELMDMPLSMQVGDSKLLNVKVLDKDKTQIFLPNGDLSWSLVFGGSVAAVDGDGNLTANAVGSARVRVSEIGAGLYSDGDVTVTAAGGVRMSSKPRLDKFIPR